MLSDLKHRYDFTSILGTSRLVAWSSSGAPEYRLFGSAQAGGTYNSHLVFGVLVAGLGLAGMLHPLLVTWVLLNLSGAMLLDQQPLSRQLRLQALPGQLMLYAQLFAQFALDALPVYALAFALYIGIAPLWYRANLGLNTFVVLYMIYMLYRIMIAGRYLYDILWHWDDAMATPLRVHERNFCTRSMAARHVIWSYLLGNVGLVVRCSSQLLTIAVFERLRLSLNLDLASYAALRPYLPLICIAGVILWTVMLILSVPRMTLLYYKTHRTLHSYKPLYHSIHAIHHRGILPTPLDSGTISPAEFALTEFAYPAATLAHDWAWILGQLATALFGHWPGHRTGSEGAVARHHLIHHRYFVVNYGLLPHYDEHFGTLQTLTDSRGLPPHGGVSSKLDELSRSQYSPQASNR